MLVGTGDFIFLMFSTFLDYFTGLKMQDSKKTRFEKVLVLVKYNSKSWVSRCF